MPISQDESSLGVQVRLIIDNMPVAALLIDSESRTIFTNTMVMNLFAYSVEGSVDKSPQYCGHLVKYALETEGEDHASAESEDRRY